MFRRLSWFWTRANTQRFPPNFDECAYYRNKVQEVLEELIRLLGFGVWGAMRHATTGLNASKLVQVVIMKTLSSSETDLSGSLFPTLSQHLARYAASRTRS